MLETRLSKTCDDCKFRKKRQMVCHFSQNKRRTRIIADAAEDVRQDYPSPWPTETGVLPTDEHVAPTSHNENAPEPRHEPFMQRANSEILETNFPQAMNAAVPDSAYERTYMDEMLERDSVHGKEFHACLIPKSEKQGVSSSSLSLFSDGDIRSISSKLSNARFGVLIESFSDSINKRLDRKANEAYPKVAFKQHWQTVQLSADERARYVQVFFDQVHPIFPFLVRDEFQQQVLSHSRQDSLERDTPFFALYHAIQAIGSQHSGNGAFEPGIGPSWQLFQAALDRLHELIGHRPSLTSVQALLAMFCYAMTHCGGQIAETLLSEAARMAQFIRLNRGSATLTDGAHQRTFWVIYSLEKLSCFCQGRTSVIPDEDIGCHIPLVPEATFEDFNWFLTSIRFGRLLSQAQRTLFSISASMQSRDELQRALQVISNRLEAWRLSIPVRFRPGEHFARAKFSNATVVMAALRLHLSYHNTVMVLCRLNLRLMGPKTATSGDHLNALDTFMSSARHVIELTVHLEVEPYSPSVLLTVFPLSAFLSLFHLVIDNPGHPQTQDNLAFLAVAAGYFRRLEYIMKQEFPFSIFPKLAAVAQDFVLNIPKLPQRQEQEQQQDSRSFDTHLPGDGSGALGPLDEDQRLHQDALSDTQTVIVSVAGLSDSGRTGSLTQQADHGYPQDSGANAIDVSLEQLVGDVDDTLYPLEGAHVGQGNEVMDFFGNLLDETYDSLYGPQLDWQ